MQVSKIYNTRSGELRAKVTIEGRNHTIKVTPKKQSLISSTQGAYLIRGIDIEQGVVEYQLLEEYSHESLMNTKISRAYVKVD